MAFFITKHHENIFCKLFAMLGGPVVTMAWHILRLQMEKNASRYGGLLQIY
jgi:hypothetical protein